jgi:DNA-binding NtrC family response regulator
MKACILIVDDEKEFVEALAERLAIRDYHVTTSLSGEDAVKELKKYNFDVIILDVVMPGMDGIETLREIKKIKPLTEVIMLTGHATLEAAIEGLKLGALDFLLKPCETEDLIVKIDKAYEKKVEQDDRIRAAKVEQIISSPRSVLEKE